MIAGTVRSSAISTLRTDSEFKLVFSAGNRFFRDGLGFYVRINDTGSFRYGMAVPRRFGNAVKRNKVRRRLRALIHQTKKLPSVDVVISVYKPCRDLNFELLNKTLSWGFERIHRTARKAETSAGRHRVHG